MANTTTPISAPGRVDPLAVARSLTPHMPGWRAYPHRDRAWMAILEQVDDRRLGVQADHHAPARRVTVSGWYPERRGDNTLTCGLPEVTINISATREPAVIARDIYRRLMPTFNTGMRAYRARIAAREAAAQARSRLTRTIAEALAGMGVQRAPAGGGHVRLTWMGPHPGQVMIDPAGHTAEFQIHADTPDAAHALAHAIATTLTHHTRRHAA